MNVPPKSKWYWRLLRWGLIGIIVLATLAAILVTEEDWRSKREWEAYKRAAEARGERLDVASVIPPTVPDDQNFFFAPIVAHTLQAEGDSAAGDRSSGDQMDFRLWRGQLGKWITQGGSWQKGTLTDLKQWQDGFRRLSTTPAGKTNGFPVPKQPGTPAADVLFALKAFDPELEELWQASLRPYMRIPLDYEDDFGCAEELLPWLATMKSFTQVQELRILAEEQNQQGEQAMADVKHLVRVNDCIRKQPFLISQLVRMAIMAYVVQSIYEGLAQHSWSDPQLAELERILANEDFLSDYQFTMNGEKVFAIDTYETQRITRETKSWDDSSGTNKIVTVSLRWTPAAFFYQDQLCHAQLSDQILSLVDVTNRIISPTAYNRTQTDMQAQIKHCFPYKILALLAVPPAAKSVQKFAMAQAGTDFAHVACALERYRLAHGEYPASLDALAPEYIDQVPHDIINGQPLHYRRTDDGRFVLYSVGWNEKDDGGTVVLAKDGTVDREKGDWVWQYPVK